MFVSQTKWTNPAIIFGGLWVKA